MIFRNKLLLIFVALTSTVALIYFSLKTPSSGEMLFGKQDKILHFVSYAYITGLYFLTFKKGYHLSKPLKKAILTAFFLGTLLECLQYLPYFQREFDVLDLLMNTGGIVLAWFVFKRCSRY